MAGKITELTNLTGAAAAAVDLIEAVDVSDTTMAATGTNKKMTFAELISYLKLNEPMFNFVQDTTPTATVQGQTWLNVSTGSASGTTWAALDRGSGVLVWVQY